MERTDRVQIAVWGALACAVLLVGARWVSSGSEPGPGAAAPQGLKGSQGSEGGIEVQPGGGDVLVHVAGAVRRPGVYRLPADARVVDAIERAGGGTSEALREGINLAARLADGQQVVVPARAPEGGPAGAGAVASDGPLSLGTATQEQLEEIDGIGPVTAGKIVAFRDERGGLASVEELGEVHGIGPSTLEALSSALQP